MISCINYQKLLTFQKDQSSSVTAVDSLENI